MCSFFVLASWECMKFVHMLRSDAAHVLQSLVMCIFLHSSFRKLNEIQPTDENRWKWTKMNENIIKLSRIAFAFIFIWYRFGLKMESFTMSLSKLNKNNTRKKFKQNILIKMFDANGKSVKSYSMKWNINKWHPRKTTALFATVAKK